MKLRCLLASALLFQAATAAAAPASTLSRSTAPTPVQSAAAPAALTTTRPNIINVPSMSVTFTAPQNWTHKIERSGRLGQIVVDPVEVDPDRLLRCILKPQVEPRSRGLSQQEINARMLANPATSEQVGEIMDSYISDPLVKSSIRGNGTLLVEDRLAYWFVSRVTSKSKRMPGFVFTKIYTMNIPGHGWVVICAAGLPGDDARASAMFDEWLPSFDRLVMSMRFSDLAPPAAAASAPATTLTPAAMPAVASGRESAARPSMAERQARAGGAMPTPAAQPAEPASADRDVEPFSGYGFAVRKPLASDRSIMDSTVVQEALAQGCVVRKPQRQIVISRHAGPLNVDEVMFPQGCFGSRGTPPLYGVGTIQSPARPSSQYLVFDYDDRAREQLFDYLSRQ